jgi:DNA-binding Lrp family transcriptional regulator
LIKKLGKLNTTPTRLIKMTSIDDTDRELIALLRDDGRATVAALAAKLKVARGTVQNRMARLLREGVIVGYTVRLKPQVEAHRIRALMSIAVEGNRGKDVLKALRGHPNVSAIYSTNGRWDIVAELQAETLEAFDGVLGAIRLLGGIANTETSILLSTHKL